MKKIKLLNLNLRMFKGIKELDIDFNGNDTRIYGENGTGKTTIFDAFVWLLFNKDSSNNSTNNMGIKTVDSDGKVIHKLDHEVEATLLVDDKELTLKKIYKEQWTKQRGSNTESFSGHTTEHFINGVPSKKNEYDDAILEIVDEDVFQLLTNPSYFNEVLHWKDRRDLLLEIAGDITDEDVIKSHKELEKLLDVLNGNSIEDHKKIIASKRRKINKRIEEIPTRIDEINRNMPVLKGLDESNVNSQLEQINTEISEKNEQINSIKNGSEVNEIKKQISDIDLQIANVRNEHTQNEQQAVFKLKAKLQEERSNHSILQNDVRGLMQQKESNDREVKHLEQQMNELRDEFKRKQDEFNEWNGREFEHSDDCVCPTCKQNLPTEQVAEAEASFNQSKAKKLESIKKRQEEINKEGVSLKGKVDKIHSENESLQVKIDKITKTGKQKAKDIEKLEEQIKQAESTVTPIDENEQYIKLNEEKQSLKEKIEHLETDVNESIFAIDLEIEKLQEEQRSLQVDLAKFEQANNSKKRIDELQQEERNLAAEFEELEHQLYLTEEFTRRKVEMLTENINEKFKYARFKLFEEQVNGGLKEVCETTYEGVPFSSGLNNAARINVGLDIINTLSTHFGVQAPIFVDNAESVTELIDVDTQVISLVVSEDDKELRVEKETTNESVVA